MFKAEILKSKRFWVIGSAVALIVVFAAVVAGRVAGARRSAVGQVQVAEVTIITAISSVETSGQIAALQSSTLNWGTTGYVAKVNVQVGDQVKAGDVLMELDAATTPQNVILAQAELISAQKALDDLLHPSALTLANAQKAVADAQQALDKAKRELYGAENPAGESLHQAVADAQLALETAQANLQLANVSQDAQSYNTAVVNAQQALQSYWDIKLKLDANSGNLDLQRAADRAWTSYQNAYDQVLTLQLRISTDSANKQDAVNKAQEKFDQAVTNLNSALAGPDRLALMMAQAKVAVAEATLAEAQKKLESLQNGGDPNDVAAARAKLQAAQANANALRIIAPFDGEVLVINYQPGDPVTAGLAAAVVANRTQLHADVAVDESDVSAVQVGNEATATFDSLPDVKLAGHVSRINAVGQTNQGLVRYTVRVDFGNTDPAVLLGMTANINIVTKVQEGALAVPLDAVQLDAQGEYVNRAGSQGQPERVPVVSGETQGDLVIITPVNGDLKAGDKILISPPKPASNGVPFGPG